LETDKKKAIKPLKSYYEHKKKLLEKFLENNKEVQEIKAKII
jgi:hypothetical protein